MNAVKEYEVVNAALTWVGQDPIAVPLDGTDQTKIEFLLNTYAERLRRAVPGYGELQDNRLIPDLVVQHLVSVLGEGK
jgi:hypothetical protein